MGQGAVFADPGFDSSSPRSPGTSRTRNTPGPRDPACGGAQRGPVRRGPCVPWGETLIARQLALFGAGIMVPAHCANPSAAAGGTSDRWRTARTRRPREAARPDAAAPRRASPPPAAPRRASPGLAGPRRCVRCGCGCLGRCRVRSGSGADPGSASLPVSVGDGSDLGMSIRYVEQKESRGIAGGFPSRR